MNAPDYLDPDIPANTKRVSIPIVDATAESLRGYGCLVESPDDFPVEQEAVHARVSVDFPHEFHCLLEVDLYAANEH